MLSYLDPDDCDQPFPDPDLALDDPNGLLAVGGCLSPRRLQAAYRSGIFPWFGEDEPILWWSPDPRLILWPDQVKISRSLGKLLRREMFMLTHDRAFEEVVSACAAPRPESSETWITPAMQAAYLELHRQNLAHSFEVWQAERLVGGFYGVVSGRVFFGESMFHRVTDASKVALVLASRQLLAWGYRLIDCQVDNPHLRSLGAKSVSRAEFTNLLRCECDQSVSAEAWKQMTLAS